mmetsp:Transcript_131654/g.293618  ORF Transcript_131654/g.293618 Transcript_131654/m.293618 type:complete len:211 (+) Transcript_131654:1574-2206(+)
MLQPVDLAEHNGSPCSKMLLVEATCAAAATSSPPLLWSAAAATASAATCSGGRVGSTCGEKDAGVLPTEVPERSAPTRADGGAAAEAVQVVVAECSGTGRPPRRSPASAPAGAEVAPPAGVAALCTTLILWGGNRGHTPPLTLLMRKEGPPLPGEADPELQATRGCAGAAAPAAVPGWRNCGDNCGCCWNMGDPSSRWPHRESTRAVLAA